MDKTVKDIQSELRQEMASLARQAVARLKNHFAFEDKERLPKTKAPRGARLSLIDLRACIFVIEQFMGKAAQSVSVDHSGTLTYKEATAHARTVVEEAEKILAEKE